MAIIAPSRHGYSAVRGDIGLSIIRSPTFPNPWSDIGEFEVTYYLYPHEGDYQRAEVPKVAQELIHKPIAITVNGAVENISIARAEPAKIILSAFKPAENGNGYTLRLYNPYSEKIEAEIKLGFKASRVIETDIIELNEVTKIAENTDIIKLNMKPFEVKTIIIECSSPTNTYN